MKKGARRTIMQPKFLCSLFVVALVGGAWAASASGQQSPAPLELSAQQTVRYKLIDLTLGGPISYPSDDGARLLNNAGVVSSSADTAFPDPFAPDLCFHDDCFLAHAYRWRNGVMTDLGSLFEGVTSYASSLNDRGWSIGASQTGIIHANGFPEFRATLWIGPQIISLGVVPGGSDSLGISVNNAGQAVGISNNGVDDPFSPFGVQVRTFLWVEGELRDIGTLGGPDALPGPGCNNQRPGLIVGWSFTSFAPNQATGAPTQDPFLWDNGKMRDLGNLGGTVSFGQCANSRGDVIGRSSLPGDESFHAFLWRDGTMKDLGTLGGDNSEAIWINDAGEIAGSADLPGNELHDAVRWKDGQILDLGTVSGDACSRGRGINARGQIVGGSSDCRNFLHAFVWEEGGPMIDLNTVIPPGSGLQLTNALNINDRGEILAKSIPAGVIPIEDENFGHVVLLVPCEESRGDCVNILAPASGANPAVSAPARTHVRQRRTIRDAMRAWHERSTSPIE
jgi:probable HAF family extracellular repeat protein